MEPIASLWLIALGILSSTSPCIILTYIKSKVETDKFTRNNLLARLAKCTKNIFPEVTQGVAIMNFRQTNLIASMACVIDMELQASI